MGNFHRQAENRDGEIIYNPEKGGNSFSAPGKDRNTGPKVLCLEISYVIVSPDIQIKGRLCFVQRAQIKVPLTCREPYNKIRSVWWKVCQGNNGCHLLGTYWYKVFCLY